MADPPYTATEPEEPNTRELRYSDAHRHQSATGIPPLDIKRPQETGLPQSQGTAGAGAQSEQQAQRNPLEHPAPGDILTLSDGRTITVSTVDRDAYAIRYNVIEPSGGTSTYDLQQQYWPGFASGAEVVKAAPAPTSAGFASAGGKPEKTTQFELDQREFLRSHETRRVAAAQHTEARYDPEHVPPLETGEAQHADQKRADAQAQEQANTSQQAHKTPDEVPKDAIGASAAPEDAKQREPRFRETSEQPKQPDEWPKDAPLPGAEAKDDAKHDLGKEKPGDKGATAAAKSEGAEAGPPATKKKS